ncbi:MAG: hypothetical protein ACHQ52_07415 [Candidatus Eisenbacteria bacterium]
MRALTVPRLVLVVAACLVAATAFSSFRGEDWLNFEQCLPSLSHWHRTVFEYRFVGFFRPLWDFYVGATFRLFGLHPWPHTALQLALFGLHAVLLAWIVRLRGGERATAWAVAAALLVQANAYAWTVLWISNSTGSLLATFTLSALVCHHRAVVAAGRGRPVVTDMVMAALATAAAGMVKEEVLLLPLTLLALELPRWGRLSAAERRVAIGSWLVVSGVVAAYLVFRFAVAPPHLSDYRGRYAVRLGPNWVSNLPFFGLHLLPLPAAAALMSRWVFPRAWTTTAHQDDPAGFGRMRAEMLAGALWLIVSLQLYLPITGHGYGYLYVPAMAVALAVGPALSWAATTARGAGRDAAVVLAPYALAAMVVTGAGLGVNGWFRYGRITRETFAALDAAMPTPTPGARFVFLDPLERETLAGRSLFNMVFDNCASSMVRLHFRRDDLDAVQIEGPAARAAAESLGAPRALWAQRSLGQAALPPPDSRQADPDMLRAAKAVFFVREGHLTLIRLAQRDGRAGGTMRSP